MEELTCAPIRLLSPGDDVSKFSCGNAHNDAWLHNRAFRAMHEGTARVYVLEVEGAIAGFYSLSTHSIVRMGTLPGSLRRNSPDPIPCTLLGQLAVSKEMQGRSLGARLLQDAIKRAIQASNIVASRALVVEAANEEAAGFYKRFGFKEYHGPLNLFIKLPSLGE